MYIYIYIYICIYMGNYLDNHCFYNYPGVKTISDNKKQIYIYIYEV